MTKPDKHSRRDFLQGRAAVRVAANKAQEWVDSAAELLSSHTETETAAHVVASRRAMACEFALQYHEADSELTEAMLAAFDTIERIETQLTIYREHSEVLDINDRAADVAIEVDARLFSLLQLCQQLFQETSGAFDITSGPLSRVWGFLRRAGQVPGDEELAEALAKVDGSCVLLDADSRTIRFREQGTEINFNSIGKGYALDQAAAELDEAGHTDYLWHGGGSSVLARGKNRCSTKHGWTVGLRDPQRENQRLAEFVLADRALATAGGATQFFEHDGQRYSHILDPRTGKPAYGVFTSTVLAPTAALADGLATAFFVMDIEAVEAYCRSHPAIAAVLVCPGKHDTDLAIHSFGLDEHDWTLFDLKG